MIGKHSSVMGMTKQRYIDHRMTLGKMSDVLGYYILIEGILNETTPRNWFQFIVWFCETTL